MYLAEESVVKDVVRTFIAIDMGSEIQSKLDRVLDHLKTVLKTTSIRWVPARNIHLTLKFLGDVSVKNISAIQDVLQAVAGQQHPFEIQVGNLGAFPSPRRARVIWVGVEAPADLNALQHNIENELARLGYVREDRPFSPHLTLGRVSNDHPSTGGQLINQALDEYTPGILGTVAISSVQLFRSDLQPGGSRYTSLFTAKFGA
jgi:RNA 2',3'-cyclic 3'-phosphodiesterase